MSGTGTSTSLYGVRDAADRPRHPRVDELRSELERARRHVAVLEAEARYARSTHSMLDRPLRSAPPESPSLVLACHVLLGSTIVLPVAYLAFKALERLFS